MNDVGEAVRKGFYDALNGQVSFEGSPIPIVDEKLDLNITEHTLYMLIGGQQATAVNTKSTWASEADLNITVVNRRMATSTKTTIENIADQMLQILFPTRATFGISIGSPFSLSYVKYVSDSYTFEKMPDGWQISKQMIFKTRITQTP